MAQMSAEAACILYPGPWSHSSSAWVSGSKLTCYMQAEGRSRMTGMLGTKDLFPWQLSPHTSALLSLPCQTGCIACRCCRSKACWPGSQKRWPGSLQRPRA